MCAVSPGKNERRLAACVSQKHLTPQRVASNYEFTYGFDFQAMTEVKCDTCGADLLPGTGFCRQCGAAVSGFDSSEQPTAIFPDKTAATTQRLQPRSTSPTGSEPQTTKSPGFRRNLILLVFSIVLLIGVVAALGVLSDRNSGSDPAGEDLLYPGDRKSVV